MKTAGNKKEKRFSFGWGSGVIAEEAQVETPWHVPTIQLMKYTDGEAAGQRGLRFCQYGHNGRFRRSPLMMSDQAIEDMRIVLRSTPELQLLLRRLVE